MVFIETSNNTPINFCVSQTVSSAMPNFDAVFSGLSGKDPEFSSAIANSSFFFFAHDFPLMIYSILKPIGGLGAGERFENIIALYFSWRRLYPFHLNGTHSG